MNDLEEQLWSGNSSTVQCVCTKKDKEKSEVDGVAEEEGQSSVDGEKTAKKTLPWGIIIFVVVSIFTLILAFLLGQYATM